MGDDIILAEMGGLITSEEIGCGWGKTSEKSAPLPYFLDIVR